jgi:hypothetical protein
MTAQAQLPIKIDHPSPHRGRIGVFALLFGMAAAPLAWDVQLLVSVSLSGHACYPRNTLLRSPLWSGTWPILLVVSMAGIVIAIAGGFVAYRSWLGTLDERPGSAHHLLESGDGRSRFMAMFGMLGSALFLVALVFGAVALYLVPLCGG